jgi:hypothetical protein
VTSIGNRSKEGRSTTGQRYPPSTAYSLFLEYHDRGMPSADPMDANASRRPSKLTLRCNSWSMPLR